MGGGKRGPRGKGGGETPGCQRFLGRCQPHENGKILKSLNKLVTWDGKVGLRKKLIENLVADGWTVEENRALSYEETEKRINRYRKELDTLYRWRVSGDPDDPKTIRAKDLERRIRERDVIEGVPERKLKSPDGSAHYEQSVVTKMGLDYAEYLIGKKKAETPEKAAADEDGQEILSIDPIPEKTKTSYGNWAVNYVVKIPIGTGATEKTKFFFKKKDAEEWIATETPKIKKS